MTDKWSKGGEDKFESLLAKEGVSRQNDLRKMSNPQGTKKTSKKVQVSVDFLIQKVTSPVR